MSNSYIRNMTNHPTTYDKGRRLYNEAAVWDFYVDDAGAYDDITAVVKGSGHHMYQVDISINVEENEVEECKCECPAFVSYTGICKHCVAVLLEYECYREKMRMFHHEDERQQESLKKLKMMKKNLTRHTSPGLKELLQNKSTRRSLPYVHQEHLGQVSLEPILHAGSDGITVEFKVGITQMYVMKDVFGFVEHLKKGAYHSYGKKLAFFHMEENFKEESQRYLKFILQWVRENKEYYREYGYYNFDSYTKLRQVPLNGNWMEHFLDFMGEQEVYGEIGNYNGRYWHVEKEIPKRKLAIQGTAEGVELEIEYVFGYAGKTQHVYFDNGKIYRIPLEELAPAIDFMECLNEMGTRKAYIEKADVPAFCVNLLPELKQVFQCEVKDFEEQEYRTAPSKLQVYLDLESGSLITFRAVAVYGEKEYLLYDDSDLDRRNLAEEMPLRTLVNRYTNAYDNQRKIMVLSGDDELLYELLTRGISELQAVSEVFISDAIKRINVVNAPKVTVGISLSGDLLKLDLTAGEMPREQLMELLSKYQKKKKFYRLKSGDMIKVQDGGLEDLLELKEGLQLSEKQWKQQEIQVPRYRALYMEDRLEKSSHLASVQDTDFRQLIQNMKTMEENDFTIPKELTEVLRAYQKTGFIWMKTLKNNGFGGILADDMGLGKTLQVIAFLLSEYQERPEEEETRTLIVTPASLVYNWQSELERFAPELPMQVVVGNAAERRKLITEAGPKMILITSYDLLKRDLEYYEGITFGYEVIDEAQFIKNHGTQAAKAVKEIASGFRLALTGTPIENRLSELWSIFDYLMPGFLFSARRFREEFESKIIKNQDKEALERIQKMIAPFVLRRLKRDVLKDLPEKAEENRYVRLEGEQQKMYDAHVKRMQLMLTEKSDSEFQTSKLQILAELTKIRQLCCDPALLFEDFQGESAKLESCIQLVQNAVGNQHKVLLFSQFTSMLERIQQRLAQEHISFYSLTGAVSKEKRQQMVEAFQTDDTEVFCISLKAGGTGLNLTAADIVIHYDPWWNVAAQNQATDRAHRIGQEHAVTVYKLISRGTIEENIVKLQERKRELADKVLQGSEAGAAAISREELLELLQSF